MVAGREVSAVEAVEVTAAAVLEEVVVEEVGGGAVLAVLAQLLDQVQHLQCNDGKKISDHENDIARIWPMFVSWVHSSAVPCQS